MEEISNFHDERQNLLILDSDAKRYLAETSKWAKFLSIIGFVGVGLLVLVAIFMGSFMSRFGDLTGISAAEGMMMGSLSFFYIVAAAMYIYPLWKLYQFADISKKALASDDSVLLTKALEAQKSLFKFMGILTIVILSIYALIIIFGIVSFLFIGRGM